VRSDQRLVSSSVTTKYSTSEWKASSASSDATAMMIIMRATVSDFDERVNEVVERVAALEKRQS
jgi:hypothetical protein